MSIQELREEYANQDNSYTAYPIYISVQELVCVGVIADGYSVNCPYGDGETLTEYTYEGMEGVYKSLKELKDNLEFNGKEFDEEEVTEFQCGYIWVDREFFLTRKWAQEYMKANAHNHGQLRTYVKHFERRNFEMRALLTELGFNTKD